LLPFTGGTKPVTCVVLLLLFTIVTGALLSICSHKTVSLAKVGTDPIKVASVTDALQILCVPLVDADVTSCVAAGTVIETVSLPEAQGPTTSHLKT